MQEHVNLKYQEYMAIYEDHKNITYNSKLKNAICKLRTVHQNPKTRETIRNFSTLSHLTQGYGQEKTNIEYAAYLREI